VEVCTLDYSGLIRCGQLVNSEAVELTGERRPDGTRIQVWKSRFQGRRRLLALVVTLDRRSVMGALAT
jgi:hypothetical protein